jgi:hypothetical protein
MTDLGLLVQLHQLMVTLPDADDAGVLEQAAAPAPSMATAPTMLASFMLL